MLEVNYAIAPDGSHTASLCKESVDLRQQLVHSYSYSITNGNTYTISFYVKPHTWDGKVEVHFNGDSSKAFYLYNDDYTDSDSGMQSVGNGWRRIWWTRTKTNSSGNFYIGLSSSSYVGVGYAKSFLVWGAQVEAGSFPTSYIPTSGSQVTRSQDSASMTGTNFSDWYRQDEGTLFSDAIAGTDSSNYMLYMSNGTSWNRVGTYINSNGGARFLISSITTQADTLGDAVYVSGDEVKIAAAYAVNDIVAVDNASSPKTDTSAVIPTGTDRLYIGGYYNGSVSGKSHFKKLAYYPIRLTNAELEALTEA